MSRKTNALFATTAALAVSTVFLIAPGAAHAFTCTDPPATQVGILAFDFGGGNVTITTDTNGNVVVAANPPSTTSSIGIIGCAVDPGTVTITTNANVTSNNGDGIDALTDNSTITINQNAGEILATGGAGIFGDAAGAGSVNINQAAGASVVSTGGGFAVNGTSNGGSVQITTEGSVSGDEGILGITNGAGGVAINIGGTVNATSGDGVAAVSVDGNAIVNVQAGATVVGAQDGMVVETGGAGAIAIADNGAITGGQTGIFADAISGGAITVAITGAATGGTGPALQTSATTGATSIQIGASANVVGGGGGAVTISSAGGAVTLVNAGRISTSVGGHAGLAVAMSGTGGLSLANAAGGLIDGRLTGADHVLFTNAGTWEFTGTSDFGTAAGASTNSFTNTGMVQTVLDSPTSTSSASTFVHLGAFRNGTSSAMGLVSLMNGHVGDTLTVSGLFTGATGHSVLALDAFLGGNGSMADQLHLTGGSAGQTEILINDTNTGSGAINTSGIVLVTGVSKASNFILDPATPHYDTLFGGIDHGFFLYQLQDKNGADELTSSFNLLGGQLPGLLTGLQQIFDNAGLGFLFGGGFGGGFGFANTDRLSFSDAGPEAPRVWMNASNWRPDALNAGREALWSSPLGGDSGGLASEVEVNQGFLGHTSDGAEPSLTTDAGYGQSTASLVSGMDLMRDRGENHAFVFGVLTGYVVSDQLFHLGGDSVQYGGPMVGLYSSYKVGGLRLDGDVKGDLLKANYQGQTADSASSGAANVFGAELNASYSKSLGDRWSLSPIASLSVSSASINGLQPFGQQIHFSGGQSALAGVGMRLVGDLSTSRWNVRLAASAKVSDEFLGVNTAQIDGASDLAVTDRLGGLSSDFDTRLDIGRKDGRVSAFVGGAYRSSSLVTEAVMTSGVALKW